MFPPTISTSSIPFDIFAYICLALLIAILFIALRINAKLSGISNRNGKPSRSNHASPTDRELQQNIEVVLGSPFQDFLNEDPARRTMNKKEQFAAYRDWRAQKGLNWK